MGGQIDYFGLWIDSMLRSGSCMNTCTTFQDYLPLSASNIFKIKSIEVWGAGGPPKQIEVLKDPRRKPNFEVVFF
jgi:hypothetical protein